MQEATTYTLSAAYGNEASDGHVKMNRLFLLLSLALFQGASIPERADRRFRGPRLPLRMASLAERERRAKLIMSTCEAALQSKESELRHALRGCFDEHCAVVYCGCYEQLFSVISLPSFFSFQVRRSKISFRGATQSSTPS